MEDETLHIRYLILIAAVLCAVLIGYNAFYVPDASMAEVTVSADVSRSASASGEEYTPRPVSSGVFSSPAPSSSAGTASASSSAVSGGAKTSSASKPVQQGKINLNTASAQQLETLDGVGETLAGRIIAYREQHGPFRSVEDIKNVSGIGDVKFAAIRDAITVG